MQSSKTTNRRTKKIHIFLLAGGIFIISLLSWWIWGNFSSKPLGNELEYLGKQDYGCIISFCDSGPTSTYYYSTDMQLSEVEKYFTKSTPNESRESFTNFQHRDGSLSFWDVGFTDKSGKVFYVQYYKDGKMAAADDGFTSSRKYLVTISSYYYQQAKDSL